MRRIKVTVGVNDITEDIYYANIYKPQNTKYLKSAIRRSEGTPIHEIVVVRSSSSDSETYSLISGGARLKSMIDSGIENVDAILIEDVTDDEIQNLVIDLNKHRRKTGVELKNELIHYNAMYPPNRGGLTNRYELIGDEMGLSPDRVKKILSIHSLFNGSDYEFIVEQILEGEISLRKGMDMVKWYKNKTTDLSTDTLRKMIKEGVDFDKIGSLSSEVNLDDQSEFDVIKDCLKNTSSIEELNHRQNSLIKAKLKIKKHLDQRLWIEDISPEDLKFCKILKGNSRTIDLSPFEPYLGKVRLIIGSCEYGYSTKRPGRDFDADHEQLSTMSSWEFAEYTAGIYARYLPYLTSDGSIYVIINDYKTPSKSNKYNTYSCFTEYFVIEMLKRGFYLVERKIWLKTNALPRQHNYTDAVESYEYVYRFTIHKDNYYQRSLLMMNEDYESTYKLVSGCTNHSNTQTEVRGGKYIQSTLKKVRNTLTYDYCEEIIRGNVGNPGDYYRQLFDKHHSSTSPVYLTAVLTLAATEPGDLVMDIWNGVGNSMMSSLLLGRKYLGVEIEEEYYNQSIVKASQIELFTENNNILSEPLVESKSA